MADRITRAQYLARRTARNIRAFAASRGECRTCGDLRPVEHGTDDDGYTLSVCVKRTDDATPPTSGHWHWRKGAAVGEKKRITGSLWAQYRAAQDTDDIFGED